MYVVKILNAKGKFIPDPLAGKFPSYDEAILHIETYGLAGAKVAIAR